jgi:hypothetical protein
VRSTSRASRSSRNAERDGSTRRLDGGVRARGHRTTRVGSARSSRRTRFTSRRHFASRGAAGRRSSTAGSTARTSPAAGRSRGERSSTLRSLRSSPARRPTATRRSSTATCGCCGSMVTVAAGSSPSGGWSTRRRSAEAQAAIRLTRSFASWRSARSAEARLAYGTVRTSETSVRPRPSMTTSTSTRIALPASP